MGREETPNKENASKEEKHAGFRTMIGGQALIEGIMMMGPKKMAIVVRSPEGELVDKVEDRKLIKDRNPILGWPLVRGVVNFGSSMVKGVKALSYSATISQEEEMVEEPGRFEQWIEKRFGSDAAAKFVIGLGVILGIGFSVALFILLPTLLAGLFAQVVDSFIVRNLLEGALRIGIFLLYLILVSKMKDIKRVFSYHGAEHKTITCYEKGLPLTVENVKAQSRYHPRCGTSFLFVVMIISILVFSVVQWSNAWVRMALRLLLLPVVVAISYEINRVVGRHDNWFTRILTAPGKGLQRWTTQEPDEDMIEVGIRSLELVLPEKKGQDAW